MALFRGGKDKFIFDDQSDDEDPRTTKQPKQPKPQSAPRTKSQVSVSESGGAPITRLKKSKVARHGGMWAGVCV